MRFEEIKSYGKGFTHKEKQRIGYDPDLLAYRHKVKDIYPMEDVPKVDWQALRTAGVVMPMAYHVPSNPVKPNVKEPNIITAVNVDQYKKQGLAKKGHKLTPYTDQQITPVDWQVFMDKMWPRLKPFKKDQIRASARTKGIEFNEWMIMPQTIKPLGLIQKKGYFDFKNKGNNKMNEAVQFTKPDTQYEWSEAQRYPYIKKLGFVGWNKLVNTGRQVNVSQFGGIRKINNTTALNQPMAARELPKLEPDKVQRAQQSLKMGKFELPIVMKTPQGTLELVAGNTRFTMMVAKGMTPTVWYIDGSALPEEAAGVGIITKQNTTKDVKPGDEYKNVKKLQLAWKEFKENTGFNQEAGIGIDGQSFKFKIKDLIAFANKYPVSKIDPKQFADQIKGRQEDPKHSHSRAQQADLKYPIIVVKRKNGSLWIADGTHRAQKAILSNIQSIDAKIIPIDDMSAFKVNENFADGRVKGKSRPGRVKRAGASCKGSVSSLRAKAKKYGGERGKMYHWCANMKSGKK